MSIKEKIDKIRVFYASRDREIRLLAVIFLVAMLGFALGLLVSPELARTPIVIEKAASNP